MGMLIESDRHSCPYGLQLAGQFQSDEMLIGVASRLATLLRKGKGDHVSA
jgi:Asp-tRNA(Asn)/Glu-tRNA(Gln) amidotransferase A subunit family amidase